MWSDFTIMQAKILALVAWADGEFDDAERAVFGDVLDVSYGADSLKCELLQMVDKAPERDDVLQTVATEPGEIVAAAIKNAFVLAKADGHLHDAEMALLVDLGRAAGVGVDRSDDFRRMLELYESSLELERDLFGT